MINNLQNLITYKPYQKNYPAIISKNITYSYSELDKFSSSFVRSLKDKVKEEDYVGIYLDNSADFIISVLALWKIGAIPVLLNLLATDDELTKQILFAGIKYIITNENFSGKFSIIDFIEIIPFNNKTQISNSDINYELNKEHKAVVIFTSGATGEPKGVIHTFYSLISSVINGNEILNHTTGDRWLASLPFYHIGGFQIICRALYFNTGIVIPKSFQTDRLVEAITDFKPTHVSFVSTQLKRLLDNKVKPNYELRCSLIGGGFINKDLLLEAKKAGWHPVKVYGSSETASFVCALKENDIESKGDSTGKPVSNTLISIVDKNGNECSVQTEGEIVIKSYSLFSFYLDNESATKAKLKENYYFTGDFGYLDNDGYLFVTGRKNNIIVTGGKNVNPLEVETAILKYPGIVEAAVFPIDDLEWGEIVCAVIVTSKKINILELHSFLKKELSSYKIPKKIFVEDVLPKTSLGKIERMKLKLRYNNR